ncbi:MAG TPA: hypothetical protein VN428_08550 [Bryobacteraceae bacterium]|nr:hypothetical protein [Bryobacteraceae bacterium]
MKRSRRWFLLATAFLAGCTSSSQLLIELLPNHLDGGWALTASEPVKTETLAPEIRERGPASAARAVYDGPARIVVTICEMKTSTSAFAVFQSWKARDGAQAFYHGRLFGIAEGASAAARIQLIRALQPKLPA